MSTLVESKPVKVVISIKSISIKHRRYAQLDKSNHSFLGYHELVESIKIEGVRVPVVVEKIGNGKYKLLDGLRRYEACKDLGLKTIPAVIMNYD
jgi:ParB/RepB/Spo0J family partition protein